MIRSNIPNVEGLRGRRVVDAAGHEIGTILGVYLDNDTREPEWVAVRLPSTAVTLVPVSEASAGAESVQVPFARAQVLEAPYRAAQLAPAVTGEQEASLYRHYGSGGARRSTEGPSPTPTAGREPTVGEQGLAVARGAVAGAREVGETAAAGGQQVAAWAARQAAAVAATAKEQAAAVASTAKQQAGAVAETAREQVAQVTEEVSGQAQELLGTTAEQVVGQAEVQLDQLAEAMHRLAGQTLAAARGNPDMGRPAAEVMKRSGAELQSIATRIQTRGSRGLVADAQKVVREHPAASPVVTGLVLVAGARLLSSPAGDRIKAMIAPLKEQAIEAGRSVAEELKPVVQQRVEGVKAVATQAAEQLKQEAQASAHDVQGTAAASATAVKATVRGSAATVKATAKQSASTAKRSTRTAVGSRRPALAQ